jgi:stage II sporulation protein D
MQCAPNPVYRHSSAVKKTPLSAQGLTVAHDTAGGAAIASPARAAGGDVETAEKGPPPPREAFTDTTARAVSETQDAAARGPYFVVPFRFIRVVLRQNVRQARVVSAGHVAIGDGYGERLGARGALAFDVSSAGRVRCGAAQFGKREYALPCTLYSANAFNIIEFDGAWYRGSIILAAQRPGCFSVINYCDVEDYLRGVVPLEIGDGGREVLEAFKAQAVAARTYTYKKILERQNQPYDIFPTVADQVYGGVGAEKPMCNRAILDTRDLVAVYRDSLIYAYYHSTCGGKTASIENVWDKPGVAYLGSIDDCDEKGRAYCAGAPNFTWQESWPADRLSDIINRFSREAYPQNPAKGRITKVTIESRYPCGRVKSCRISTSEGVVTYGGDRLRFVLRRNMSGFPILRSAIISGISSTSGTVVMNGKGYGHGIGMCQHGAIGRALAGQTYEHIIKAYYSGVELRSITAR